MSHLSKKGLYKVWGKRITDPVLNSGQRKMKNGRKEMKIEINPYRNELIISHRCDSAGRNRKRKRDLLREELHLDTTYDRRRRKWFFIIFFLFFYLFFQGL